MCEVGVEFLLVDVCFEEECQCVVIDGVMFFDFIGDFDDVLCDKMIVVYCYYGLCFQVVVEGFVEFGFQSVFNFVGGIDVWFVEVDLLVLRY